MSSREGEKRHTLRKRAKPQNDKRPHSERARERVSRRQRATTQPHARRASQLETVCRLRERPKKSPLFHKDTQLLHYPISVLLLLLLLLAGRPVIVFGAGSTRARQSQQRLSVHLRNLGQFSSGRKSGLLIKQFAPQEKKVPPSGFGRTPSSLAVHRQTSCTAVPHLCSSAAQFCARVPDGSPFPAAPSPSSATRGAQTGGKLKAPNGAYRRAARTLIDGLGLPVLPCFHLVVLLALQSLDAPSGCP